jgi:DNA-3-methyladenine glycosylase II
MLSKKAASTIQERLLERCVRAICADSIAALSIEDLRTIGVSANKAMSISSLYSSLQELNPESFPLLTDTEIIKRITSLRGLGAWSAKMYLIFVLDRQDILPFEDGAFLQAYRWLYSARSLKKQSIERRCRKWHPYASIGARYLYLALDTGLTKQAVPFWGRPKGRDCVQ